MSDEKFWGLIFLAVSAVGGCIYAYFSLQECTRIHPVWYCVGNG